MITAPVYNFGPAATLKAWIDQIARAGVTFHYEGGRPVGHLAGKQAIVVTASAGTPVGAPHDFLTPWLRFVLGFLGISDVRIVTRSSTLSDSLGDDLRAAA